MVKKKIVLISSLFFPRNSPRANRTTELAKEFARQGHHVTVYSALGDYDYTGFEKQYNLKIRNFGKRRFFTLNSDGKNMSYNFLNKVGIKLFHKIIEFPHIELAFKVADLLKKEKNIDLLITVAVPFPIHWGAAFAQKYFSKNNIKTWVADCGDPYMGNPAHNHPFYFKYVEKWFCRKVDYITVPTDNSIGGYYREFHDKIRVVPQGFNFEDYENLPEYKENDVPTFIYAGALYEKIRDPRPFLDYLTTLNAEFKFIIYTRNQKLISDYKDKLKHKLEINDYIPRAEVMCEFAKADFLINFENADTVQTPSKLIDYVLAKRPIFSVPSTGLNENIFREFLQLNFSHQKKIDNIDQYNIFVIAKNFIQLST